MACTTLSHPWNPEVARPRTIHASKRSSARHPTTYRATTDSRHVLGMAPNVVASRVPGGRTEPCESPKARRDGVSKSAEITCPSARYRRASVATRSFNHAGTKRALQISAPNSGDSSLPEAESILQAE